MKNIKLFVDNIAQCNMQIVEHSLHVKEKRGMLHIKGKAVSDKNEIVEFKVKISRKSEVPPSVMYQSNYVVQIFDEDAKKIADLIGMNSIADAKMLIAKLQPHIAYKLSILDLRKCEYVDD